MSREIENAIKSEDWKQARTLIRAARRRRPNDHWLLTRLSLTYYEEFDYERALAISQQALKLAPRCPLVLWDLAGAQDMLGRNRQAIAIYQRLISRGVELLAFGKCGEGLAWARGLVADCWYRLARLHCNQHRRLDAARCYRRHLAMRGPGCRSIYQIKDVRRELGKLG